MPMKVAGPTPLSSRSLSIVTKFEVDGALAEVLALNTHRRQRPQLKVQARPSLLKEYVRNSVRLGERGRSRGNPKDEKCRKHNRRDSIIARLTRGSLWIRKFFCSPSTAISPESVATANAAINRLSPDHVTLYADRSASISSQRTAFGSPKSKKFPATTTHNCRWVV